MLKSEELKQKILALKKEQAELRHEVDEMDKRRIEIVERLLRIEANSAWQGSVSGELPALSAQLEQTLRDEEDAGKERILIPHRWRKEKFDKFVLQKVTPKRIFLREPGSANSEQFTHDGKPLNACYGTIPPETLAKILEGRNEMEDV